MATFAAKRLIFGEITVPTGREPQGADLRIGVSKLDRVPHFNLCPPALVPTFQAFTHYGTVAYVRLTMMSHAIVWAVWRFHQAY